MKVLHLASILSVIFLNAQVGIQTENPKATLDINGNTIIRQVPQTSTLSGYQLLVLNENNSEVSQIDPINLSFGGVTNSSVYSAKKSSGISLLNLGLLVPGFRPVNFTNDERTVGHPALFSDSENAYIVPSSGVYMIGYTFRYNTGLQASVLTTTPGVGILRTRTGVSTLIDNRDFSGVNLSAVLGLTISETSLNSLYALEEGDKISFGLTGSDVLNVGLLKSSTSSFFIYKISN